MSRFLSEEWGKSLLLECVFLELVTVIQARLDLAGLSVADAAIATVARRRPPGFEATFDRGFEGLDGITVITE